MSQSAVCDWKLGSLSTIVSSMLQNISTVFRESLNKS